MTVPDTHISADRTPADRATRPASDSGPRAEDLSCYTANLALYLAGWRDDALDHVARTVRLAVRPSEAGAGPAFSHHTAALNELGDGDRLKYSGAADSATFVDTVAAEVVARQRALVVTYTGRMPWSLARSQSSAPHFLLVEQRQQGRWRVVDAFSALLPDGAQEPYAGWISTAELIDCATPPQRMRPEHHSRLTFAFGVPMPPAQEGQYQWLAVTRDAGTGDEPCPPDWIVDPDEVFDFLTDLWSAQTTTPEQLACLEDMWAAAQHHTYRYAHLGARNGLSPQERERAARAGAAWRDLPMALRFAADSAARGRARPGLVRTTFTQLRAAEEQVSDLAEAHGYTAGAATSRGATR